MNNSNIKKFEDKPIIQSNDITVFLNFDDEKIWKHIYREYMEQTNFAIVQPISFQYKADNPKRLLGNKRHADRSQNSAKYEIDREKGIFRVIVDKSILKLKQVKPVSQVSEIKKKINQAKATKATSLDKAKTALKYELPSAGVYDDAVMLGLEMLDIKKSESVVLENKLKVIIYLKLEI
jgi:hypothetical protein